MDLAQYIVDVPDFPTKGIVFKDITPLLLNPKALQFTLDALCEPLKKLKIDKVVGMESRGFLLGPALAMRLGAGFVPVRKKGKLPRPTLSTSYGLEYGTDTLEIHLDAVQPGDRVLIHDDVLATGGTAAAVCQMLDQMGAEVVLCNFLLELEFLSGRDKLGNTPIHSLIQY